MGNKRRYDINVLNALVNELGDFEIVQLKRFYFLLYCYRKIQLLLKLRINPKITTGWSSKENSFITKIIYHILNLDYKVCGRIGFQGLSLFVVLKKGTCKDSLDLAGSPNVVKFN